MTYSNNVVLVHLFVILIADLLAFTCILPLFPTLIDYYASKARPGDFYHFVASKLEQFQTIIGVPHDRKYNSVLFGGFLGSMFSFLQFIASPILGSLSDVVGRKPMLIFSALGSFFSYVLWSKAETFEIFLLSRFVGGISKISVSVALAVVADVLPVKQRTKGMVVIGAAFSFGFIIGPMIGAYMVHRHTLQSSAGDFPKTPAQCTALLAMFQLIWTCLFMSETVRNKNNNSSWKTLLRKALLYLSPSSLFSFEKVPAQVQKSQLIQKLGMIHFVFLLIYSGLEFTLTFLTHLLFKYNSMQQGILFVMMGLTMVLFQGGYVRRLSPEQHSSTTLNGIISTSIAFFLIGLCAIFRNQWFLFVGLIFFSYGSATVVTLLTTMLSSQVSESEQGTALGTFRSLGALSRALGPFLASSSFWTLGASSTYFLGAVASIVPCYMLARLRVNL